MTRPAGRNILIRTDPPERSTVIASPESVRDPIPESGVVVDHGHLCEPVQCHGCLGTGWQACDEHRGVCEMCDGEGGNHSYPLGTHVVFRRGAGRHYDIDGVPHCVVDQEAIQLVVGEEGRASS